MNPSLACIGGTAAYDLLREGAFVARRLGPQPTPFGASQPIYHCASRNGEFYFLSRHGEVDYELAPTFVNYRANIYALKDLGVRSIVSWSETYAICHNYRVGQYVIVTDLIDETVHRPRTFFENRGLGLVRPWPVFCPALRAAFRTTLEHEQLDFADGGAYVCIEGPRRETPAEARKYLALGGELIGMTLAPEAFLAKELQMCYASICYVAGYAENGSEYRPFENGRVLEREVLRRRARASVERLPRILERLCAVLPETPDTCHCDTSMAEHVARGQIGCDWRSWFLDAAPAQATAPEEHAAPAPGKTPCQHTTAG